MSMEKEAKELLDIAYRQPPDYDGQQEIDVAAYLAAMVAKAKAEAYEDAAKCCASRQVADGRYDVAGELRDMMKDKAAALRKP